MSEYQLGNKRMNIEKNELSFGRNEKPITNLGQKSTNSIMKTENFISR